MSFSGSSESAESRLPSSSKLRNRRAACRGISQCSVSYRYCHLCETNCGHLSLSSFSKTCLLSAATAGLPRMQTSLNLSRRWKDPNARAAADNVSRKSPQDSKLASNSDMMWCSAWSASAMGRARLKSRDMPVMSDGSCSSDKVHQNRHCAVDGGSQIATFQAKDAHELSAFVRGRRCTSPDCSQWHHARGDAHAGWTSAWAADVQFHQEPVPATLR